MVMTASSGSACCDPLFYSLPRMVRGAVAAYVSGNAQKRAGGQRKGRVRVRVSARVRVLMS